MSNKKKSKTLDERIAAASDAWESGELGENPKTIRPAEGDSEKIDLAVGMRHISMRMQQEMIDELKAVSSKLGIAYQPLIRLAVARFLEAEKAKTAAQTIDISAGALTIGEGVEGADVFVTGDFDLVANYDEPHSGIEYGPIKVDYTPRRRRQSA